MKSILNEPPRVIGQIWLREPIRAKGTYNQGGGQVLGFSPCPHWGGKCTLCDDRQRVMVDRDDRKMSKGRSYWVGCRKNWILEEEIVI